MVSRAFLEARPRLYSLWSAIALCLGWHLVACDGYGQIVFLPDEDSVEAVSTSSLEYNGYYFSWEEQALRETSEFTNVAFMGYEPSWDDHILSRAIDLRAERGLKIMVQLHAHFNNIFLEQPHETEEQVSQRMNEWRDFLEEMKAKLGNNIQKIWALYLADEFECVPDYRSNPEVVERMIEIAKDVFPNQKTIAVFYCIPWAEGRYLLNHEDLDIVGIDPYFLTNEHAESVGDMYACDSTNKKAFDYEVQKGIDWIEATGRWAGEVASTKEIFMVGQAFREEGSRNWSYMPSECQQKWYYEVAHSSPHNFTGILWFMYSVAGGFSGPFADLRGVGPDTPSLLEAHQEWGREIVSGTGDPCANHCGNGIADCDETGIDCGGGCSACASQSLIFEAEDTTVMRHNTGRADGDGWSASPDLDNRRHMLYGPYTKEISAGHHKVSFRMLIDDNTADNAEIVKIDVNDATLQVPLVGRVVERAEFPSVGEYHDFSLYFDATPTSATHMFEFRVLWYDKAYVKIDRVRVDLNESCTGHCSNGSRDCDVTGEDCGGECEACEDPCAGHCSNGTQDCGETGPDCGGGGCGLCENPCEGHCSNGARDCGEVGVDCGGGCSQDCEGGNDCSGCLGGFASCDDACGNIGYSSGYCALPGSTDPGACCACEGPGAGCGTSYPCSESVALQVDSGQYLVAEGGGGGVVLADRWSVGLWETFLLEKLNGAGTLWDGDSISLQTDSGHYVVAEGGGGLEVNANRTGVGAWETFTIVRIDGPGPIRDGDVIAIAAENGQYFVAEGGGGGWVNADRDGVGPWETFIIQVQ